MEVKGYNNKNIPDLDDLIDKEVVESLMKDFYRLTGLGTSILDNKGNILIGVGRQRICRDFHWKNPQSYKNCIESDIRLTSNIKPGKFNIIKCKNNIWDIATPIIIEGKHAGNFFMGQFLLENEPLDGEFFKSQALEFEYDEKDYFKALGEAPRMSREKVTLAMNLMVGFANIISSQSLNNIKLTSALNEKEKLLKALRTNREQFRTTFYSIAEGILTIDINGFIEQMNHVAEELTGWKEDKVIGMGLDKVLKFTGNDTKSSVHEMVRRVLIYGHTSRTTDFHMLVSRKGTKIPISLSASSIKNEYDDIFGAVVVFRDQTANLEKQKAADAKEQRITRQRTTLARLSTEKAIISGDMPVAVKVLAEIAAEAIQTERVSIWLFSEDEGELNCIELYESGIKKHSSGIKLIASDYHEYFFALRKENRINSIDVLNDPRLSELKVNYLEPHGITSLMDEGVFAEGTLAGVVCFEEVGEKREWYADEESFASTIATLMAQILINADRNKTYIALQESLNHNQALIDSIPDLVFLFSREGVFLDFHTPSVNSLYRRPEDFMNKKVDEVLPGYLAELTHKNLDQVFRTGQSRVYEYAMDDNGKIRHFDTRMVLCGGDKAMTIVREITEQKRIQKELLIAKEKAEKSDRLKSSFLANMSHEIRTPMNSIIGFASLMKGDFPDSSKKEKYLDIIAANADHLLRLIDDIIDISKIESGNIEIHREPVDIQEIFEELVRMFHDRKEDVEIRFLSGSLPVILCDKVKLSQILANLIGNAVKFTNQGYVEYSARIENNMLVFRVEDTGSGISGEEEKIIFNRFAQGKSSSGMSCRGTGLGLAIAKAYVEKIGGRIWFDSVPGKGSNFYFSVPYLPAGGKNKNIIKKAIVTGLKLNLLVAEDDILNYLFIEEIFAGMDVVIKHAANGKEAVDLCEKDSFDLVIMDIKMPVMDGIEAIKKIRSINSEIPVIAVSAHAFGSEQEKAFMAGCNDYITKPVCPDELKRKINDLVKFMDG